MTKVKIIRIITRLNIGGPTIHTVLLNAKMDTEKYESYLLTGTIESNESNMDYFTDKYGITPIYINSMSREIRLLRDFIALREIYKVIRKIKPDIVHTHTAKAGMLGRLAAKMAGVPIIIHTFHGNVFNGYFGKLKTKFFIWVEKFLARFSTKIVAISKQQKNELVSLRIAKKDKIEIIRLGFQFDNIIPNELDKHKFREKYSIPRNAKLVGIVGRLVSIKNHYLFLDIAEKLLKKYSDIYFPIIGDGELRCDIEKEIESRKLGKNVFITGFIKELKPVYADLDVVLLTSINEGTPVALIEAMACEKLVMSTHVGGVEDFIENRKNGFFFAQGEPDLFVEEIENWMKNEDKYNNIRHAASKKVLDRYSYTRLISDIEHIYEKLLSQQKLR